MRLMPSSYCYELAKMLEKSINDFRRNFLKDEAGICLDTDECHEVDSDLELITDSSNEMNSQPSSVISSDFDFSEEHAKIPLSDNCAEPSVTVNICDISEQHIVIPNFDEAPNNNHKIPNSAINYKFSDFEKHLLSKNFVHLEIVKNVCENEWHSFLTHKNKFLDTFNLHKDRVLKSVDTTGMERQRETEYKEILPYYDDKIVNDPSFKNRAQNGMSKSVQTTDAELKEKAGNQNIHQDNNTDKGKWNSASSSSANNFTVSKSPHFNSTYPVKAGPSNSSNFPFGNKNNHKKIPERFLEHTITLSEDSSGKSFDPRLNPNKKRKMRNDGEEIVLKRVKWPKDSPDSSNLKGPDLSQPKPSSVINPGIPDPPLKSSKLFSKHNVSSVHKTKVPSSSKSPNLSSPRIQDEQHISADVASDRNLLSNSLLNISPPTRPLKRRRSIPSPTSALGSASSLSPTKKRTISSSSSTLKKHDAPLSTSPLEMRDISSTISPREKCEFSPSPSEKCKTTVTSKSMDDHSWTLPFKKRKLPYDLISPMECSTNISSNKISILDSYSNCESICQSKDEAHFTKDKDTEMTDMGETIPTLVDLYQVVKGENTSSCATSKIERRNQNSESSPDGQTSDPVTIDTSEDQDCTRDDSMTKTTENSPFCRRWNSNTEQQQSLDNDAVTSKSSNVDNCLRHSSISIDTKENHLSSEISPFVKGLHSDSPHEPLNKSISTSNVVCNSKKDDLQWKIWREKYLKLKPKRLANKSVGKKSRSDKISRTKLSHANNHDSSIQSSEMQTMNSLVRLGNYFDKEGILKIVHVCSFVEIGEHVTISVKLPLKLVSKLCWNYYLNSLLMHFNKLILKEKQTLNSSSVNILVILLKYPFAKHLIRHSNNGLNGDLKYIFLRVYREHLASFAIAHENIITTEQTDEILSVNPSYVKSSIKPLGSVVEQKSELKRDEYVCFNSYTLPEAFSSDCSISFCDSGSCNETGSINCTPLEDRKFHIQHNNEISGKTNEMKSITVPLNSVVDDTALQNLPSTSNNSADVCLNFHISLQKPFSSSSSTLCDSDRFDENEETKINDVRVKDIKVPTLQNNKIESGTLHDVKSVISPLNSVADCNVLQNLPSELKSADNVCLNSPIFSSEFASSQKMASELNHDYDMLNETQEIGSSNISSLVSLNSHPVLLDTSCSDCEILDETNEIQGNKNIGHDEDNTIVTKQNDEMIFSEYTGLVSVPEMLDKTEKIQRKKNIVHDDDNKIASIEPKEIEYTVYGDSHPVLPGACANIEELDETKEKVDTVSSTLWLTVNSMWEDFFQFTKLKCYFGSERYKTIAKLLREKKVSFPKLDHFFNYVCCSYDSFNYDCMSISKKYRNCPVNYYGVVNCRNFDNRQSNSLLTKSFERLKAKYLCLKYFSNKISVIKQDVLLPVPEKIEEYETYYFVKTIENNFSPPEVPCFKQSYKLSFTVYREQNKGPVSYKVDSELKKPISVDTEKNELYSPQSKKPNHHKVRQVSLKEINEICNMIKAMKIAETCYTASGNETENNSDIVDNSFTVVNYQKCRNIFTLYTKRLPSKYCPELSNLCRNRPLNSGLRESPRLFNSDCQFKNETIHVSSNIDEVFKDLNLFKPGSVLQRYLQHLKGCGDHTVNFNLIKKTENDLDIDMLDNYKVLKGEVNHYDYTVKGQIHLASNSENYTRLEKITKYTDYIKKYEIACKSCLV